MPDLWDDEEDERIPIDDDDEEIGGPWDEMAQWDLEDEDDDDEEEED